MLEKWIYDLCAECEFFISIFAKNKINYAYYQY
jgi:hypothetical protein